MDIDTKGCTQIQVVDADALVALTSYGWVLLSTYETEEKQIFYRTEPVTPNPNQGSGPGYSYSSNAFPNTIALSDERAVKVRKFVMGLPEQSHIRELNEVIRHQNEARYQAQQEVAQLQEELKQVEPLKKSYEDETAARESRIKILSDANRELTAKLEQSDKARLQHRNSVRKLVRAVGQIRAQEILGNSDLLKEVVAEQEASAGRYDILDT